VVDDGFQNFRDRQRFHIAFGLNRMPRSAPNRKIQVRMVWRPAPRPTINTTTAVALPALSAAGLLDGDFVERIIDILTLPVPPPVPSRLTGPDG